MAKRRTTTKSKGSKIDFSVLRQGEVWSIVLILVGVVTLLSLVSAQKGSITEWWTTQLRTLVGGGIFVLSLLLIGFGVWGIMRSLDRMQDVPWYRPAGALLFFVVLVTILHMDGSISHDEALSMAQNGQGGGMVGYALSETLIGGVGYTLAWVVLVLLALAALMLWLGPLILAGGTLVAVMLLQQRDDRDLRHPNLNGSLDMPQQGPPLPTGEPSVWQALLVRLGLRTSQPQALAEPPLVIGGNGVAAERTAARIVSDKPVATSEQTVAGLSRGPAPGSADTLIPRIIGSGQTWRLPNMTEILDEAEEVEIQYGDIKDRARIIEQTLADFGVPVRVVEANPGPAVTQFGLQPGYRERRRPRDEMRREAEEILRQRGYGSSRRPITEDLIKEVMEEEVSKYERVKIKVSKIQALTNDLALALSASPIRIEAPVPGRPLVGLEVPNTQKALVSLRGVLESDTFRQMNAALRIALGQDTAGQAAVADMARMPHLLIAGATGSGKSVCVNAIIATLLLTHTPDTLRFLMIDPKMVELTTYNGIPHLLSPVVVELERTVPLLRWATGEMDRRYKLFAKEGARNLEAFNAKAVKGGEQILPYIILVIDELADLMMSAPDDVERYVCRLAQMSRATGIHLILATQRPSVDVVTGLIKANFPSRIAFAVTSQIDSRVILDTPGAESLLGRGDMLFMRPDSSKLERLQGGYVSDTELERLVRYWKGVRIVEGDESGGLSMPGGMPSATMRPEDVVQAPLWEDMIQQQRQAQHEDDLYGDAVEVVRSAGRASVSLLQRRLRIGYSRAARLIDLLEERGVVGQDQGGSLGREVYLGDETEEVAAPAKPVNEDRAPWDDL
ncbi:MAG: DNA translocase FtsK [Anaerolineales bacterium]|nr:DNA translocase FtsK [Anaerolineales bacterium]MCO5246312.1 DNA translocase FtsK [Anaerolineae bacterium]